MTKLVLLGASYGSRESLHFMRRHPDMVEASILDGIAPPSATQILDSTYVATAGRAIAAQVVNECRSDSVCVAQYGDLAKWVAKLTDGGGALRRTAQFGSADPWHTIEVAGASVLSVLGVASSDEDMRASVPRIISELAQDDTLHDEFALRVFLGAAIDPSLQTASRQTAPLIYYVALCGDRPQGEPKAGNRMLCDALGVPFSGHEAVDPVSSPIPTLLISSGYDAQTPAALADEAAKTLSNAHRAHFANAGHVAFARPLAMACAALIMDAFLRDPRVDPPTSLHRPRDTCVPAAHRLEVNEAADALTRRDIGERRVAEGQDQLVLPLGRFLHLTALGLAARSASAMGSEWDCPSRTSAVLPTLPGNTASAPLRTVPPARSLESATTDCARVPPTSRSRRPHGRPLERSRATHGGSAETARGLEREPRQYCPAVSAVLHWSRGRPRASRRV